MEFLGFSLEVFRRRSLGLRLLGGLGLGGWGGGGLGLGGRGRRRNGLSCRGTLRGLEGRGRTLEELKDLKDLKGLKDLKDCKGRYDVYVCGSF